CRMELLWTWGTRGHYLVIVPPLDLVIVHRVNTDVSGRRDLNAREWHLPLGNGESRRLTRNGENSVYRCFRSAPKLATSLLPRRCGGDGGLYLAVSSLDNITAKEHYTKGHSFF